MTCRHTRTKKYLRFINTNSAELQREFGDSPQRVTTGLAKFQIVK